MIKTNELRGLMAKHNKTQAEIAKTIGITPKTFYFKMKKGVFGSDEIEIMISELKIDNPMDIFFANSNL